MRTPAPRQLLWFAVLVVSLAAFTAAAWPVGPFLLGLAPDDLPLGRIALGTLFAAVTLAALVRIRRSPVWLGWLIAGAWAVALAAVAAMGTLVWLLLGSPGVEGIDQLSPRALDAIATRSFAVVAGMGGVALLVIAYRRQRTVENGEQREGTRLFTERFTTASEQLGHERASVRLAGVHALAHLADDAPEHRDDLVQMVIDVLCAYLRMPYDPAPGPLPRNAGRTRREEHYRRELEFAAMREVRHTIIRVIGNRLRADTRWRGKNYDFTGVVFDGGDFTGACFSGGQINFTEARFSGDKIFFTEAKFSGGQVFFTKAEIVSGLMDFSSAEFTDGWVSFAEAGFTGGRADFTEARFAGSRVDFSMASFDRGQVSFVKAGFDGGHISFTTAKFSGSQVSFAGSSFTGGWMSFAKAEFTDGQVSFAGSGFFGGRVSFAGVSFSGSKVTFARSSFTGGWMSFAKAKFADGQVLFTEAEFSGGWASFAGVGFTGSQVSFTGSSFASRRASFIRARTSGGRVDFNMARFTGGRVTFTDAKGVSPYGLQEAQVQAMPGTLSVPAVWERSPRQEAPSASTEEPSAPSDP
ncbi:pentapeptide repeat-containing protein [Nocardiopsis synnemataformans]|uniref:pentapeptide repeat-containing protein n=1 Tax=Nocardiopsis synnemataformans TaxID=61305 RepID=UPI003EBF5F27